MNTKAITTIRQRYGVSNVSKLEEFVNISRPDKYSPIYQEFIEYICGRVGQLAKLLSDNNIAFSSNEFIDGHLYRIYVPSRDLLFDFEYYPVVNFSYNYIRVNYNEDISQLFQRLFPETLFDTEDMMVCEIPQKDNNRFLKENNHSPIYNKSAIILAFTKDDKIYQSMVVANGKLLANVSKLNYQVSYGTIILLRYFKEVYNIPEIRIKSDLDNSFRETSYQLMNLKLTNQTAKKKIWWSPTGSCWHIKKEHIDEYVPFYFTEKRIWVY